jgi:hypothetical protein
VPDHAPGLFPALLGAQFATLPAEVRHVHSGQSLRLHGRATITRGQGWLSRFVGFCARLPAAAQAIATEVTIVTSPAGEHWQRRFGRSKMPSRLSRGPNDLLRERLGLARFDFRLCVDASGFHWQVERVAALGIALPAAWFSGVRAYSFAQDGRYRFLVQAELPVVGFLVRYEGSLREAD